MKILLLLFIALAAGQEEEQTDCERTIVVTLEEPAGVISSPNFLKGGDYNNDVSCTWSIVVGEPDLQIELNFGRVLTEGCCDYVEIHDGSTSSAPLIERLGGNITQSRYLSTFGAFFITFISDDSITDRGFTFQYAAVRTNINCGESLNATQAVQSLNYPSDGGNYPNSSLCFWTLRAPDGFQVELNLTDMVSEACCDDLQIRNGTTSAATILLRLAGRFNIIGALRFLSTSRVLFVRFRSDEVITFTGFRSLYRLVADKDLDRTSVLPAPKEECGSNLEVPEEGHGAFSSPNYPGFHSGSLMCRWIIRANTGVRIRVWFSHVSTNDCCDWIIVRDGSTPTSSKLGIISGLVQNNFHSFVSSGNNMMVEFNTNGGVNGRGFLAFYERYRPGADKSESECGGELIADDTLQYFSTPNWPDRYDHNLTCEWVVRTSTIGYRVRVHFLGILTQRLADNIVIFGGAGPARIPAFHFSGTHQSPLEFTGGFAMTILFTSDSTFTRGGFRASYTQIPGNRFLN